MQTLTIDSKTALVFSGAEPEAPIIYLNTFSGDGQKVYETTGCPLFTFVAISDLDWNHDVVPWNSPPAFKNADPCTSGADDYLQLLTEKIIPTAEKEINGVPRKRQINQRLVRKECLCQTIRV